ncbi:hypothetical protein DFP73DRAFT_180833 [Morchella snyderi]|nr:hypothetical protein DFP73DRAFT_180833 [Morchella snyderi]
MGKEDYVSTGGSLKLKGIKDGGIKKKKSKKSRVKSKSEDRDDGNSEHALSNPGEELKDSKEEPGEGRSRSGSAERDGPEKGDYYAGKTEAERRFEERKRKRMDERLKREGIKSHKQRVEEYNKYLSNLSEHHDMPRIGPG